MDLLFIMLLLFFIYLVTTTGPATTNSQGKVEGGKFIRVTSVKKCPPHRWRWIDLLDEKGVKQGEKLVCLDCGPLDSQSGRE